MQLHFEKFSNQAEHSPPIIILHGLFGSGKNWGSCARRLAKTHNVITVDLRNHGRSPHANSMSFPEMANDVLYLMQQQNISDAIILGHSMGGKVAMQMTLQAKDMISKLIVVDIAPRVYAPRHHAVFAAIDAIDASRPASRAEADKLITPMLPNSSIRMFLLTNLKQSKNNGVEWKINMQGIRNNYRALSTTPTVMDTPQFTKPTLFLAGSLSPYINENDGNAIKALFPNAQIEMIESGHWVHIEQPELFAQKIEAFLSEHEKL